MDVLFPGRNDRSSSATTSSQVSADGPRPTSTIVDREGEVVWTQEYIRYRVNGCDHATAVARVMTQIDAGAGLRFARAKDFRFRRAPTRCSSAASFGTKYRSESRPAVDFVDQEGVVWIQEYLRYRVNGATTRPPNRKCSRRSTVDRCGHLFVACLTACADGGDHRAGESGAWAVEARRGGRAVSGAAARRRGGGPAGVPLTDPAPFARLLYSRAADATEHSSWLAAPAHRRWHQSTSRPIDTP